MSIKVCSAKAQHLLLLGLGLILAASCERAFEDKSKAKISFDNSAKVSAQSELQLRLAVVEIKAKDGSSTERRYWFDQEDDGSTLPPSYNFEVPKGGERLVQVVAVYETLERGLLFAYADHTQTFTKPEENVTIALKGLNNPATTVETSIQGRFLANESSGPTGKVDIFYTPEGKPPIQLFSHDIIAGWFETLAFNSIPFTYKVRGGITLFGGAVNSETLKSQSQKWVQVTFPERVQNTEQEVEEKHLFGFFGPGATNKSLCLEDHGESYLPIGTNSNGDVNLLDHISPAPSFTPATECDSTVAANYRDYVIIDLKKLAEDGPRDGNTLRPPFRMIGEGQYLGVSPSPAGDAFVFDWKGLPGVTAALDGFDFWIRPSQEQNYLHDGPIDGVACSRLAELGFKRYKRLAATETSLTVADTSFNENSTAVLCPVKGLIPFTSALRTHGLYPENGNGGGGGGGSGTPYLRLEGLGGDGSTLTRSLCYPVSFATYAPGGGDPAPTHMMTEALTIYPVLSGTDLMLYLDEASCSSNSSPANPPYSIPASSYQSQIYYARFDTSAPNLELDFDVYANADGVLYEHRQPFFFANAYLEFFRMNMGSGIVPNGTCEEIVLKRFLPDGSPDSRYTYFDILVSAQDMVPTQLDIYMNTNDCGDGINPVTSVHMPPGSHMSNPFYVKGTGNIIDIHMSSSSPPEYMPPAPLMLQ